MRGTGEPLRHGHDKRFGMRAKIVLGLVVLVGSFAAARLLRRHAIEVVDTTTPDPFGDAVLRERL